VRFVKHRVALGQVFSECFGFVLSIFHQCSILIVFFRLLLPRQTSEGWESSKSSALSGVWEHWIEKGFHFLYPRRTGHEDPEGSRGITLLFL
jgi:hypothetical protein